MGLDQTIRFPTDEIPSLEAIRAELLRVGQSVVVMMIDGLPAFPDEIPEPGWKELRLGSPSGMITLRAGLGSINCVIWGNSDDTLKLAWSKVIWASATAGNGQIDSPTGPVTPSEFAKSNGISAS
jgi:hypothetical protein